MGSLKYFPSILSSCASYIHKIMNTVHLFIDTLITQNYPLLIPHAPAPDPRQAVPKKDPDIFFTYLLLMCPMNNIFSVCFRVLQKKE